MNDWFSARELAGLPDMPGTVRGVQLKVNNSEIRTRPRKGRGGGVELYILDLPEATRIALGRRAAAHDQGGLPPVPGEVVAAPTRRVTKKGPIFGLPNYKRLKVDARLYILRAWELFHAKAGLIVWKSQITFCDAYNARSMEIEPWVYETVETISWSTIQGWRKKLKEQGAARLGTRYGNRKGSGKIDSDEAVRGFIVALIVAKPHVNAKHVMRGLRARFNDRKIASYRSVQRFMSRWKIDNADMLSAVSNPDHHRNTRMPAFGSASEEITRLNELWEMDSTPADVMCTDGRHAIIGVIDIYSRRGKLLVTETSKSTAICALIRSAMLKWGVPERIKIDEGQDYTSKHLTRALADLGIEQDICPPYTPEAKPHIERFFGTCTRGLFELLPGYTGHCVADAQALRARKSFASRLGEDDAQVFGVALSAAELQTHLDSWCDNLYGREVHRSLKGRSPFEVAAAWRDPIAAIEDERALDVLLAESPGDGWRQVTKKGIRLDRTTFVSVELGGLVGMRVQVRFDAADMGRIYCFDIDGQFICIAKSEELLGVTRRDVAIAARHLRRRIDKAARAEARRLAAEHRPADIAAEILDSRAAHADGVVAFPTPQHAYASDGLDAAADAAAAGQGAPAVTPAFDDETLKRAGESLVELAARRDWREIEAEENAAMWERYKRLRDQGEVSAEDAAWMERYAESPLGKTEIYFDTEFHNENQRVL